MVTKLIRWILVYFETKNYINVCRRKTKITHLMGALKCKITGKYGEFGFIVIIPLTQFNVLINYVEAK